MAQISPLMAALSPSDRFETSVSKSPAPRTEWAKKMGSKKLEMIERKATMSNQKNEECTKIEEVFELEKDKMRF